jgi:hypothetical protein
MEKELIACLEQERSIFRNFSEEKHIGNFVAFKCADSNQVPHWNLCYPKDRKFPIPAEKELHQLLKFYSSTKTIGHLLTTGNGFHGKFAETSEYFQLDKQNETANTAIAGVLSRGENDLAGFSDVIKKCFDFDTSTIDHFKEKMLILAKLDGSKFYVVKQNGKIIGCCSTFRGINGTSDFLFNVATLPEARRTGAAKSIISYAAANSLHPLYTYSHNSSMRTKILPGLGFRSIGQTHCVPLTEIK